VGIVETRCIIGGGGAPEKLVEALYPPGTEGIGMVRGAWGVPKKGKGAEACGGEDE
jgi:hypothetical protein